MGYMAKAWVGALLAVVTAVNAALSDDLFGFSDATQVVTTAMLAGATLYGVYKTRNTPPTP